MRLPIREILTAWTRAMHTTPETEALATARLTICVGCEHHRSQLRLPVCSACGCALKLKVFTPEPSCPHQKWPL